MFGSQLVNEQATWEDIVAVLDVMEKGRWTSVYTYDHFLPPWSRTNEVFEHDSIPTLEGWSLLAGIAAVTYRLRLGVLVSGNTYRSPALMAKMAATIDEMSGGRVSYTSMKCPLSRRHSVLGPYCFAYFSAWRR